MSFSHYHFLRKVISRYGNDWYILRIDEPTETKNFKGETVRYDHYYRLYSGNGNEIKYGKFQKLEKLAKALNVDLLELPVVN